MELVFLGVGGAFARYLYQSSIFVKSDDETLLVDCGPCTLRSLEEFGYNFRDVDNLFVTHLHADHINGIEEFAIKSFITKHRPRIFLRPEIANRLWNCCLRGGLEYFHGQREPLTLKSYFDVQIVGDSFEFGKITVKPIKTKHACINDDWALFPSFGLEFVTESSKKILYTGDTTFDKSLLNGNSRDLIFHDCFLLELSDIPHTRYKELLTLPKETRSKIWLFHYGDSWKSFEPEKDGFAGFVRRHQKFQL